jgi:hypothetical protein
MRVGYSTRNYNGAVRTKYDHKDDRNFHNRQLASMLFSNKGQIDPICRTGGFADNHSSAQFAAVSFHKKLKKQGPSPDFSNKQIVNGSKSRSDHYVNGGSTLTGLQQRLFSI